MADYKLYKDMNNVNDWGVIYKGKKWIPFDEGNTHYNEIMRQVNAGTLTITAA